MLYALYWIYIVLISGLCSNAKKSCEIVPNEPEEVFYGWPFSIECGQLYDELEEYFYNSYNEQKDGSDQYNATCVVIDLDKNKVLLNRTVDLESEFRFVTFNIPDLTESTSLNYQIQSWLSTNDSECCATNMSLIAIPFSPATCEEFARNSKAIPLRQNEQERLTLSCEVPYSVKPTIHEDVLLGNRTIAWYRNCKEIEKPKRSDENYRFNKHEMIIPSLSFEHFGIYTCSITHNGMKRFVTHFRICVSPERISTEKSITCTRSTYYSSVGSSVGMTCVSNIGSSMSPATYVVRWHKQLEDRDISIIQCSNSFGGFRNLNKRMRKSCSSHSDNVCYKSFSRKMNKDSSKQLLVMEFNIKTVEESDFGLYKVSILSDNNQTSKTFMLAADVTQDLTNRTIVYAMLIAMVALLILSIGVLWWNRIYVRVLWKRKFGSSCEDNKQYGAYFVYCFTHEMDVFAQQQTRDVVSSVRDTLEGLGYTIFDEYKDGGTVGGKAESSLEQMQQCHRVVIILTSAFLKDHWTVFTLQQGFEEMIKSKSKLIFVLVPGMRQYLKQYHDDNDTLRMAWRAVKLNGAIEWSSKPKFNSKYFSLLLEDEMPKLRSQQTSRHNSTTSSILLHVQYKTGIRRTISNDTRCTDLASTDSSAGDLYVITKG